MRFKLLVKNLLDNAIKYNHNDKKPVHVTTQFSTTLFTLNIIDHGEGIAPEHINAITEPFYRADPSRQRQTGGYGLGLFLCKSIVEAHHGELHIESKENKAQPLFVVSHWALIPNNIEQATSLN